MSNKLKVLFFNPKTLVDSWPFPVDTLTEIIKIPCAVYPVLSALIADLPVETDIFDGFITRETFRNYKKRLSSYDILAISMTTPLKALDTELTIRLAKALNPQVKIILGGNHATAFPEEWIKRGVDFVVTGEGEIAFPKLMKAILANTQHFEDVPNLVYRDGNAIKKSHIKAPSIALDDSPFPAWESVNFKPYGKGLGLIDGFTATVEVSRGCAHRCDFCNINGYWGYKQRYKSIDRICEELERLHKLGVREFFFLDDNFGHNVRHTTQLFEEMIRRDFKMCFGSFLRSDTAYKNPELVELAARAGMRIVLMGLETLDKDWLAKHQKGVKTENIDAMYAKVYNLFRKNNIFMVGLFITPPDADESFNCGRGTEGVVCDFYYTADLTAQKGSVLYDELLKTNSIGKDMFYHDWNLPSILLPEGKVQKSRKRIAELIDDWNAFGMRSIFSKSPIARSFLWRHAGILVERMLCSSLNDIRRYRVARDASLNLAERQQKIIDSVLNDAFLEKLLTSNTWKSPLWIRNGLWSEVPIRNK